MVEPGNVGLIAPSSQRKLKVRNSDFPPKAGPSPNTAYETVTYLQSALAISVEFSPPSPVLKNGTKNQEQESN